MKGKVAVVTGGASGIGKAICEAFLVQGVHVCIIDKEENPYFTGDLADEKTLETFSQKVISEYGKVDYLVNNAMLSKGGLETCSFEDFNYVLRVGVSAPFYLTKLFRNSFARGASIVNISSTRAYMSQKNTESYSAAKGGINALTHALAMSLSPSVRVNAIAPGWIDTRETDLSQEDNAQHSVGRVGRPEDIVSTVMFLCGEGSAFINGQVITVDGGMTKNMIYHNDEGWTFEKQK